MTKPLVQAVANVTVQIGETAKLECRVASDPLPYIRFMKTINDTEYEVIKLKQFQNRTSVESISPSIKTEFFERFLSIHNVTFADEGKYTCRAGSSIGETRKDMYLIVTKSE
jgi:hypothetical protein